jgi:ABC-type phosphate transport system substrate-binding protein
VKLRKIMVLGLVGALLAGALALTGCGGTDQTSEEPTTEKPAEQLSGTINIQGSDTMLNIATAWSEAFMDENPGVEV